MVHIQVERSPMGNSSNSYRIIGPPYFIIYQQIVDYTYHTQSASVFMKTALQRPIGHLGKARRAGLVTTELVKI